MSPDRTITWLAVACVLLLVLAATAPQSLVFLLAVGLAKGCCS
jgi:hypothetical protein